MGKTYCDIAKCIELFIKIQHLIACGKSTIKACQESNCTLNWYLEFKDKFPKMSQLNEFKSIFPIFINDGGKKYSAHGSCCYVSLLNDLLRYELSYLITAKHVIERIPQSCSLAIPLNGKFVNIDKKCFHLSDSFDIAALPLDEYPYENEVYSLLENYDPIDISNIPQLKEGEFFFYISGWPANKYIKISNKLKYDEMFNFFTLHTIYDNDTSFIYLSHNRSRLTDTELKPVKSYVPEGVSGGACFAISLSDKTLSYSLQGIYIEYHENRHMSRAVKIEEVARFLNFLNNT